MNKKLVLELKNHKVYYVKTEYISYYITIPNQCDSTNICLELKSKMNNYNLEMNDEIWVMENVKNTFSYIDNYNITLVLPIFNEDTISILEKIDESKYTIIDRLLAVVINYSYQNLKEQNIKIASQVLLVNNDRYKTFINWFIAKYQNRIICKDLLELIQIFNANATSYKKIETPGMTFVVGSYNTEVDAPNKEELAEETSEATKPKKVATANAGFTSYWLLAIITIVVASIVAVLAFTL